ncbi:MAG: aspartyl/asparaginyl beta-hydroxylase domain-containing protein [Gemmataceae bacterium]
MAEPPFLNDVALFIPEVQELLASWQQIRDEIDALTAMFKDPFVDYPRYQINADGDFLYEKEWKVLPTTVIEGEALDATIQSPIGAGDTELKEAHAQLLALVRANLPTLDRILAPAERARRCANGFISRIRPGTILHPHTGWVRDWLRVHIGLRTDPGASITVGSETRTWTDGGILAFRDGGPYLHSVQHNGTRERLIVSTDFRIAMLDTAFARASIDMRTIAPYVS